MRYLLLLRTYFAGIKVRNTPEMYVLIITQIVFRCGVKLNASI